MVKGDAKTKGGREAARMKGDGGPFPLRLQKFVRVRWVATFLRCYSIDVYSRSLFLRVWFLLHPFIMRAPFFCAPPTRVCNACPPDIATDAQCTGRLSNEFTASACTGMPTCCLVRAVARIHIFFPCSHPCSHHYSLLFFYPFHFPLLSF